MVTTMTDRTINLKDAADIVRMECGEWTGLAETIVRRFKKLPPVDAVEVVRCKDCKFYHRMTAETGICELACRHLGNDGFCSEGERKDGEGDENH